MIRTMSSSVPVAAASIRVLKKFLRMCQKEDTMLSQAIVRHAYLTGRRRSLSVGANFHRMVATTTNPAVK